MPNKYYLRHDRTAVKPEMEDPTITERLHQMYLPAARKGWFDHLASLPALDVDPDYLKRLSPGWFEGVERYEILSPFDGSWIEVSKNRYDKEISHDRRLTIVAPQEATNFYCVEFERNGYTCEQQCSKCKKAEDMPQEAEKGQEREAVDFARKTWGKSDEVGNMIAMNDFADMMEFMRDVYMDKNLFKVFIERFRAWQSGTIPATPQPVTGEWQLCPLCNGQGSVTKPAHIPGDVTQWLDSEGIHTCHICNGDKLIAKPQAASRPSDAVEMERLKDWKESAMQVMNEIDLQECGKVLNVPLGQSIADKILPGLKELKARVKELEDALRNTVKVYSLMNKKTCESMGLDDPETFKAFLHAKSLLRTPPTK